MEDLNRLVTAINGLLRLKVVRLSSTSTDGTVQPSSGTLTVSDDQDILTLYDADGGGGGGSVTTPMKFGNEHANYLTCTDPNGNTVNVAKSYLLQRNTYDGLTLTLFDGLAHTYAYHGINTRTDTVTLEGTPVVFQQLILDQYFVNDILQCTQPGGTGLVDGSGKPIVWQDTNEDGRCWATQFASCQEILGSYYTGFQLVKGSDWYPTSLW